MAKPRSSWHSSSKVVCSPSVRCYSEEMSNELGLCDELNLVKDWPCDEIGIGKYDTCMEACQLIVIVKK